MTPLRKLWSGLKLWTYYLVRDKFLWREIFLQQFTLSSFPRIFLARTTSSLLLDWILELVFILVTSTSYCHKPLRFWSYWPGVNAKPKEFRYGGWADVNGTGPLEIFQCTCTLFLHSKILLMTEKSIFIRIFSNFSRYLSFYPICVYHLTLCICIPCHALLWIPSKWSVHFHFPRPGKVLRNDFGFSGFF